VTGTELCTQLERRIAELTAERDAAIREADRLRHGAPIEGDFVCPDSIERDSLKSKLAEVEAERDDLRESVRVWMASTADLGAQCQAKEAKLAEVERERSVEVRMYRQQLARMSSERDEQHAKSVALILENKSTSAVNEKLRAQRDAAEADRDSALSELAQVKAERDDARACAALEAQHHGFLRKERDEARTELAQVKARLEGVEKVFEAAVEWRHDRASQSVEHFKAERNLGLAVDAALAKVTP
jgi:hypothetical protein